VGTFYLFMDRLLGLIDDPPGTFAALARRSATRLPVQGQAQDTASITHHQSAGQPHHQGRKVLSATSPALRFSPEQQVPPLRGRAQSDLLHAVYPQVGEPRLIEPGQPLLTGDSTSCTYANPPASACARSQGQPCTCPRATDLLPLGDLPEKVIYLHSLYGCALLPRPHRPTAPLDLVVRPLTPTYR